DFQLAVLRGMADALRGWRNARAPQAWAAVQTKLAGSPRQAVSGLVRELSVVFADGRALDELRMIARDASADAEARRAALRAFIESRPPDLLPLLQKLMADRATVSLAVRGLAAYDHPGTPALILRNYHFLRPEDRPEAINTLVSRRDYARALLMSVAEGKL